MMARRMRLALYFVGKAVTAEAVFQLWHLAAWLPCGDGTELHFTHVERGGACLPARCYIRLQQTPNI